VADHPLAAHDSIAAMLASLLYLLVRRLLTLGASHDRAGQSAQVEILVLRHQLEVLRRQVKRPVYRHRDRALLAAASRILPRDRWGVFLVRPETLLRWHRSLVSRKWTQPHRAPGRPAIDPEVRKLILRLANENPRWGYLRIKGELAKLGIAVSATSIAMLLRRSGVGPAPRRGRTWPQFLKAQAAGVLACDFFTVETAFLQTLYVLFFIEIGSRRVHVSASTRNPDASFVTQQARNIVIQLADEGQPVRFLIRDRDTKFSRSFDDVFASAGIRVIRTPIRAPNANAFAERWVETLRAECLDWLLILGPRHLDRVLPTYVQHYNRQRPHRGLQLRAPERRAPIKQAEGVRPVERRDLLGGLVHEYRRAA
jgi:transposase InsO family protein